MSRRASTAVSYALPSGLKNTFLGHYVTGQHIRQLSDNFPPPQFTPPVLHPSPPTYSPWLIGCNKRNSKATTVPLNYATASRYKKNRAMKMISSILISDNESNNLLIKACFYICSLIVLFNLFTHYYFVLIVVEWY